MSDTSVSLTLRVRAAESALRRRLQAPLAAAQISFEQWQVLAALLEQPGIRMTDLAEAAVLPAGTLTRHVDKLVERALVIRRIDPNDRRRTLVALSGRGERLATDLSGAEAGAESPLPVLH